MNEQINLLTYKRKRLFNRENILQILQISARILLISSVLCSISLFLLNRSGKLPLLEQQDKTISANLSFVQQKIIKFLLIRERLKDINPLISKKSNIDGILSQISTAIPSDVSVDSFGFTKNNITITVSSSSLISINTFLDFAIEKVNQKQFFKKVTVNSLTADSSSGKFILVLNALYYE